MISIVAVIKFFPLNSNRLIVLILMNRKNKLYERNNWTTYNATSREFSVRWMMLSFSTRKSRYFTIGNYRVLWTCFCQWRTLWKSPWLSFALKESLSSSRRTRSPTYKRARFASFCKSVSKQINLKYQTIKVSKVGNFENCYVNNKIDDIINHFSDWTTLFEKVV